MIKNTILIASLAVAMFACGGKGTYSCACKNENTSTNTSSSGTVNTSTSTSESTIIWTEVSKSLAEKDCDTKNGTRTTTDVDSQTGIDKTNASTQVSKSTCVLTEK